MSMGSHLVEGGEHSRGKTEHWIMETLIQLVVRKGSGRGSWRRAIQVETGWWLRASEAVSVLAKEAEVQGNAPARTGTGMGVRKPGGCPGLGRASLLDAAQHCALGWRER